MKRVGNRSVGDKLLDAARGGISEVVQPGRTVAMLSREQLQAPFKIDPRRVVDVVRPPDVHPGTHGRRHVGEGQSGRGQYREAQERQGPDPSTICTRLSGEGHIPNF